MGSQSGLALVGVEAFDKDDFLGGLTREEIELMVGVVSY